MTHVCDCGWQGHLELLTVLTQCPACKRRGKLKAVPPYRKQATRSGERSADMRFAKLWWKSVRSA